MSATLPADLKRKACQAYIPHSPHCESEVVQPRPRYKLWVDVWVEQWRSRLYERQFIYCGHDIRDHSFIVDELWFLPNLHFIGDVPDPPLSYGFGVTDTPAVTKRPLPNAGFRSAVRLAHRQIGASNELASRQILATVGI